MKQNNQSLAVKYRPKDFDSVSAQKEIKIILKQQIQTKTFQHAYLFAGNSGCGKTTTGRIFLNELNNHEGNIIELDMASNGGVDKVREIITDSQKKSLDSEYKTFLLDEVHMTSLAGWNALLKLLEEPPKYTIFVLCTTNPEKIPETILNRVQRFDFTKIPTKDIVERLEYICHEENLINNNSEIRYEQEALEYLAKISEGGMRTAISYMDKCLSLSKELTVKSVTSALGIVSYDEMFRLTYRYMIKDVSFALEIINNVYDSGKDLKQFIKEYFKFMIDICKFKVFNDFTYLCIPETKEYRTELEEYDYDKCFELMNIIKEMYSLIKYETDCKYIVENIILQEFKEV